MQAIDFQVANVVRRWNVYGENHALESVATPNLQSKIENQKC